MQRVVSINLNGNAYQLDENAYNALFAYLDGAEAQLKDNPDRTEIIADLEQAVAEKCSTYLGPHKTVVTAAEVDRIIAQMGPVDGGTRSAPDKKDTKVAPETGADDTARTETHTSRRLYQIREGAKISGVCMGLAAFLNIDVTLVRVVFVLFAIATGGWGILAYAALMFILPHATTHEQAAAGSGATNPQSWAWDNGWPWDRHGWPWDRPDRDQRREWRHQQRQARWSYGPPPIFGTLSIIICVVLAFFWLSFWTGGGFFFGRPFFWGWPFWGFPHWIGILLFFMIFRFLLMPLRMARRGWYGHPGYGPYGPYPYPHDPWLAMWRGMIWLGMMIFFAWLAYHYIPEVHDFIQRIQTDWYDRGFSV